MNVGYFKHAIERSFVTTSRAKVQESSMLVSLKVIHKNDIGKDPQSNGPDYLLLKSTSFYIYVGKQLPDMVTKQQSQLHSVGADTLRIDWQYMYLVKYISG